MKIVTFPLRIDEDFHKELKEAAYKERISIHEFILQAIQKQIKEGE